MKKRIFIIWLAVLFCFCGCKAKEPVQNAWMEYPLSPGRTVSMVAVGDNLIHSYLYQNAKRYAGGNGFDFLPIYERVSSIIKDADLAFINQETPLGGTQLGLSGYPMFNSPQELGKDLATLGFDVVNHATNHILDRGEQGVVNTLAVWKQYPDILAVGAYRNKEEMQKIHIIERSGVRFAVLSYTYGTNGLTLPQNSEYEIAPIDESLILRQVEEANEVADVVLVSMHWGTEDSMDVENWQRLLAKKIADKGGDILIGHHPHVLRTIEWVNREDGTKMLCAYSLGNFVSTQITKNNLLGGILSCDIELSPTREVTIENVDFLPTIVYYNEKRTEVSIVPLDDFTEEMARSHGAAKDNGGLHVSYFKNLASTILKTD